MAYNYFPVGYQAAQPVYYQQPYAQQSQPVQQQTQYQTPQNANHGNSIIWVQGEAAAKSFPCAPGNSILLMDSESSVFYIKSVDTSGMPLPLRIFDYTERIQQPQPQHPPVVSQEQPQVNLGDYVTREEFENRIAQLMQSKDQTMQTASNPTTAKANTVKKEKTNA